MDFGSTFTKLLLVDPQAGAILARAYRPTTVGEGVEVGLRAGLADLALDAGPGGAELVRRASPRLACSSAAGGLRMVAVGLVRELTAAAATAAALGAGARLLRTYSHRLTPDEVAGIGAARPDVLLLAGGTDGGDRQTLLHNAAALAVLPQGTAGPLVVAGNKEVTGDAVATLRRAGHDARPAPNVLPSLGRLEVAPAQEAIRQVFLERIVHRKGLDGALAHLDGIVLPTPAAVLNAAALLRESPAWPQAFLGEAWPQGLLEDGPPADGAAPAGLAGLAGLAGDLVIVDVGGATTDVHSAGDGTPSRPEVYLQGLPEPRLKRTVEGDLGLRVSAPSTWEAISGRWGPAGLPASPPPPGTRRRRRRRQPGQCGQRGRRPGPPGSLRRPSRAPLRRAGPPDPGRPPGGGGGGPGPGAPRRHPRGAGHPGRALLGAAGQRPQRGGPGDRQRGHLPLQRRGAGRVPRRSARRRPTLCAWPPGPPSWPSTGTTCCGPPACSPPPIPRGPGA